MKTLILKRTDGTIERFAGEEASKKFAELPVSAMALECMLGGVPLTMPEGGYVIEDSEHPYLVEDFIKN